MEENYRYKNRKKIIELNKQIDELKQKVEELKGKRLEFYNDEVRQTRVINGAHFDTEQLLVFSEYAEHEKIIIDNKEKEINELKQQLYDLPKQIVEEIKEWIKSQIIYYGDKASDTDILIADVSNQLLEDLQNNLDTILENYELK